MAHDSPGMLSGTTGQAALEARTKAPVAQLVTLDDALVALDQVPRPARRLVAHLLTQMWMEGVSLGPTMTLPASMLEELGVAVARRHRESGRSGWVMESPRALVEDISELGRFGDYLPEGWVRLAVSDYLVAVLLAILTGEPQPFEPDDAENVGEGASDAD